MSSPAFTPAVGDAVVLRALRKNPHVHNSEYLPLRIGIVVELLGETLLVKLHMCNGGMWRRAPRWARLPRIVGIANVSRRATEREVAVGHPNVGDGGRRLSREEIEALYPQAVAS